MPLTQELQEKGMPTRDGGTSIPSHVFREYDIRGKAYEDIDLPFCYWLGRAFGETLKSVSRNTAIVGHDNRKSSPEFHRALTMRLAASRMHSGRYRRSDDADVLLCDASL